MIASTAWQEIRALRATPTGGADIDPDRKNTYAASLRQAEELALASAAAGYSTRPLPLFYSLSQAGRAIAAAYLSAPWTLRGHGLTVKPDATQPILETIVAPSGRGRNSFTGVAEATGSPKLAGNVQLGALWAANPDLKDVPIPSTAGNWPRALEFRLGSAPDSDTSDLFTQGIVSISVDLPGKTGGEIASRVAAYPTLRNTFGTKQGESGIERAQASDQVMRHPDPRGVLRTNIGTSCPIMTSAGAFWRQTCEMASYKELDTNDQNQSHSEFIGVALPEIAGEPSPFPLMLWWPLLLGLSSLARYEPALWTAAIDLDRSDLAVSLERVLDIAEERVPFRILQSLRGVGPSSP